MDGSYHYPPELMQLLIDTIPLLCRSKAETLLFLRGAGADEASTSDVATRIRFNKEQIHKFDIVRTVLERLNERGESALRVRREIVNPLRKQIPENPLLAAGRRLRRQSSMPSPEALLTHADRLSGSRKGVPLAYG